MTRQAETAYDQLCDHLRETALLGSVESLLGWDERTKMPVRGGAYRADQTALLAGIVHGRRTNPRIGDWLAELESTPLAEDLHSDAGTVIRRTRWDYDKQVKIPQALVEEISRTTTLGQQTWVEARKDNDFASLAPVLDRIITLKREQAEAVGYEETPYDALLDDFEPGETTANVCRILEGLRADLVPLVAAIAESPRQPETSILNRDYPVDIQKQFGTEVATRVGFDFERGRLDTTHHPFCTGLGPDDCRITTRYEPTFFSSSFFGILHEAGHGFYELGMRNEWHGLPPGTCTSLGIHESQSRFWENMVGRSRAFWDWCLPRAQQHFPGSLGDVEPGEIYFAVNAVKPSLIRVEADEVTYNLHIIIRFELEQAMIAGDLVAADLPAAWNEKYQDSLGITPPDDADGVMQDIHWSAGLIGYFPTYSLGNLYAAQFLAAASAELGDIDEMVGQGQFEPLQEWMGRNIHHHGQCFSAAELVTRASGQPLSHQPLVNYLKNKLLPLYGLAPEPA
ncbi:MAG: carboxypeptidase M32 [Planctomycetota bacterium]|nr:carboxypeptidase M32 [Planctomycetota bacterium]